MMLLLASSHALSALPALPCPALHCRPSVPSLPLPTLTDTGEVLVIHMLSPVSSDTARPRSELLDMIMPDMT